MTAISSAKPNLKLITFIVVAVHLLLIFYAHLFFYSPVIIPVKKEKLLVKTIKLSPPKSPATAKVAPPLPVIEEPVMAPEPEIVPVIESEPEPVIPVKEEPIEEPAPEPESVKKEEVVKPKPIPKAIPKPKPKPTNTIKKPAPKPIPKKKDPAPLKKEAPKVEKPIPKKKEIVPEAPKVDPQVEALKQKKRELLNQAKNAFSRVDTNSSNLKGGSSLEKITIPSQLGELKIDTISSEESLTIREIGYRDQLAYQLKRKLTLPEYGVVKLKLTLNRQGKVTDVTITQSENATNKSHIKKMLPTITFLPFGDNFSGYDTYTFQITLNSE